MRHFFVINPHSFRTLNSLKQILMDIENCFSVGRRMKYRIYISRHPRDAIAAVHRYLLSVPFDETARVYAVGGDGILFDCLNGMINFQNAELTCVPYGNTNNYIRAFGGDAVPAFRDIRKLCAAPSRPVDVIRCGANYALNDVNIGFIGQTVVIANTLFRHKSSNWVRRIPSTIYFLSALRALSNKQALQQEYTVVMDGEDISGRYSNILFSNGACMGGKYIANPLAMPDDGRLDALLGTASGRLKIIRTMGDYRKGRYAKHKIFLHKTFQKAEIKSSLPLLVALDGEAFYAQEVTVEIVPGGVKFFAPENIAFADFSDKARAGKKGGGDK
ncbi:MAG: hypothetical protein LBI19_01155 [Oscillospiraceae bacterium]|jgi:diacylglycerol kinase family enzyme|nr:hypothetical protein [Oscillospiraceae bacterium]